MVLLVRHCWKFLIFSLFFSAILQSTISASNGTDEPENTPTIMSSKVGNTTLPAAITTASQNETSTTIDTPTNATTSPANSTTLQTATTNNSTSNASPNSTAANTTTSTASPTNSTARANSTKTTAFTESTTSTASTSGVSDTTTSNSTTTSATSPNISTSQHKIDAHVANKSEHDEGDTILLVVVLVALGFVVLVGLVGVAFLFATRQKHSRRNQRLPEANESAWNAPGSMPQSSD